MIAILLVFLNSFVNASEQYDSSHAIKNHISQINPRESLECPFENRDYTRIEQDLTGSVSGNYYACNMRFKATIEINKGLLLIHNCNFTYFASGKTAISIITPDNTQESVEIQNCHFYFTQKESIHIDTQSRTNTINILNCTFEKCKSSSDTNISCIYLKVVSGNIENCKFINNLPQRADIYYSNYAADGKVTFKNNLFRRSDGDVNDDGNLIAFDTDSYFDFIGNLISVGSYCGIVRIFSDDSDLTNIDKFHFEGNSMFPVNNETIANKKDLIKDFFPEKDDLPCPPIVLPIEGTPVKDICGSPFEHLHSQAIQADQSFVSIVYCTFSYINNNKTFKGGAIYIHINENMPVYDEPIRIYYSDFYQCNTLYGCAVYIECYQDLMKFDFQDCYFGNNFYDFSDANDRKNDGKGGAVYIKTKFSCFEFHRCSFFENRCGEGGAIYYLSETSSSEPENIPRDYSLHVADCRFYHNEAYVNGGGIFISITGYEHSKPYQIENNIFYQTFANEEESQSDQPENGGAIYYSTSYTNHLTSASSNGYELRVINCEFVVSIATYRGGSIYLLSRENEPSRCIEITQCYFNNNKVADKCYDTFCSSGSDVFFEFDSIAEQTKSNKNILDINDCTFQKYQSYHDGGSISILISKEEPSKSIEINKCTIRSTNDLAQPNTGGCIYYYFSPSSNAKTLLDDTSSEKVYALHVIDCTFNNNVVTESGGCVAIIIENREPSNPIEINGCSFNKGRSEKNGGHIYFKFNPTTKSSSVSSKEHILLIKDCSFSTDPKTLLTSNDGTIYFYIQNGEPSKSIELNNCSFTNCYAGNCGGSIYYYFASKATLEDTNSENVYSLNIVACNFISNSAAKTGGSIGIVIEEREPLNPIQISGCSFDKGIAANNGGHIYFMFNPATSTPSTTSNAHILLINDCLFSADSALAANGGSICILVQNNEPSKTIELNNCSFTNCNAGTCGGSIYYYFASKTTLEGTNSENIHSLNIVACNFISNSATQNGGSIGIVIEEREPSNSIQISGCSFDKGIADSNGGHIYFMFNPTTPTPSTTSNAHILLINDCLFSADSTLSANGGSICILVRNNEPSKTIELNNCSFTGCIVTGNGAAIYYSYTTTTSTFSSGKLLDETSSTKVYALNVVGCTFTTNKAQNNGGAVGINIGTKNPTNSIEFRNCTFTKNSANDENTNDNEFGGAIYYRNVASSSSATTSSDTYSLSIVDSIFNENEVSDFGGALSIYITNANPLNHIQIVSCSFDKNKALKQENNAYGASIYYDFTAPQGKSSSKLLSEESLSLNVNNCNFTEGFAQNTGDIYLNIGGTVSALIEFNSCLFKDSQPEGIFFESISPTALLHINDCDFYAQSNIYYYCSVISVKIENCRFNDMTNRPIVYQSASQTVSENNEFRVENCNFTQVSDSIVSLVYFVTPISTHFYFISNNITIENDKTRALGAKEEISLESEYWHFENNTITPGRGIFIKTESAKKIPASCLKGFICSDLPQCSNDMHCEFDEINSGEDHPSVNLSKLSFYDVFHTGNGAAIYVNNFHISCNDINFTMCTSSKYGGGIYIYLDKEIESPISLEKLHFKDCTADCGGGIYVYSNTAANKIMILKSIFEENHANEEPKLEGDLFGGSAIYMAAENGKIIRCTFKDNQANGVKIINDYQTLQQNKMSLKSESSILIEECTFEANQKSKSSIFYVRGKERETTVDVKNCIFKGNLAEGTYHIDGDSFEINKEPLNLHLRSCKFVDGMKSAVNFKKSRLLLDSIENNDEKRFLNSIEKEEKRVNSKIEMKIISYVFVCFACFAAITAFIILSIVKGNKQNEEKNSIEL